MTSAKRLDEDQDLGRYLVIDRRDEVHGRDGSMDDPDAAPSGTSEGEDANASYPTLFGARTQDNPWQFEEALDALMTSAKEDRDVPRIAIRFLAEAGYSDIAERLRSELVSRFETLGESDDYISAYILSRWSDDWGTEADSVYDDEAEELGLY